MTVALARVHLGERVTRVQEGGAVLTMLGVLAVAAGWLSRRASCRSRTVSIVSASSARLSGR